MSARASSPRGTAASVATFVFAVSLAPALAPLAFYFLAHVGWAWGGEIPRWAHLPFVGYGLFVGIGVALELLIVRFAVASWAKRALERAELSAFAVAVGAFAGAIVALLLLVFATGGEPVVAVRGGLFVPTALGAFASTWTGAFTGARIRLHTPLSADLALSAAIAITTAIVLPPSLAYLARFGL